MVKIFLVDLTLQPIRLLLENKLPSVSMKRKQLLQQWPNSICLCCISKNDWHGARNTLTPTKKRYYELMINLGDLRTVITKKQLRSCNLLEQIALIFGGLYFTLRQKQWNKINEDQLFDTSYEGCMIRRYLGWKQKNIFTFISQFIFQFFNTLGQRVSIFCISPKNTIAPTLQIKR